MKISLSFISGLICATGFYGAFYVPAYADDSLTPHQSMAREIYAEIVAIPTSAGKGQVPVLVSTLVNRFRAAGFSADNITELRVADKMALIVRYPGRDRSRKGIGFMGHMDVVPAKASDWVLDPFTLTEKDGFFIGRGSADNKLGIVGLTATFIKLKKSGYVPDRDLVIIFSGDEETGMTTIQAIADDHKKLLNIEFAYNGDAAGGTLSDTGEPVQFGLQAAEKTYHTVKLTTRNRGGHSSRPRSDNAIYDLMHALTKIEKHRFPIIINDVTAGFFMARAKTETPEMAGALRTIVANPNDAAADKYLSANVLYNATLRTTCVTTMLSAGHAENALPQSAEATVNCRIMPGSKAADVRAELVRVIDNPDVVLSYEREAFSADPSPLRDDVVAAIRYGLDQHYKGVPIVPNMSSGATDGYRLRAVGIPVYSISGAFAIVGEANAHGLNEKVRVKSFYDSLDFWERLIKHTSGGVK